MALAQLNIREHVDFDARNSEHRKAYIMLQYFGRQHPELRFNLKYPHTSVLPMMQEEIAKLYCFHEIAELGVQFEEPQDDCVFVNPQTFVKPFLIAQEQEILTFYEAGHA